MKKVLFISLGSRGDMEPFLALGEEMQAEGNHVAFCFPAQFEQLAQQVSPNFYAQSSTFLDLLNSIEVRKIIGRVGSKLSRLTSLLKLTKAIKPIQYQLILDQEKAVQEFQPDLIIFHIKCIYPYIWALRYHGKIKLLSPMPCILHETTDEPHIGFGQPGPTWWNKFTYSLALYATVNKSILGYGKKFLEKRNLQFDPNQLKQFLKNDLPVEYAYNETLYSRPTHWPNHVFISSFRERNKVKHYTPTIDLQDFLSRYPNALYIGFGSMVNSRPQQIGKDIISACSKYNLPVIINKAWGGIDTPNELPAWAIAIQDIPFDFLFEKVGFIIHHGGSGTTHSALLANKPQAIIPHLGDQFFWNRQIEKHGKGVAGFSIDKWNLERFEKLVEALLHFNS